jgi:hypothetical protein
MTVVIRTLPLFFCCGPTGLVGWRASRWLNPDHVAIAEAIIVVAGASH